MSWPSESVRNLCLSLLVSAVVVVGNSVISQNVQQEKLEQNIKATESATTQMRSLELSLAIFQERYITRAELEQRLRELRNGT